MRRSRIAQRLNVPNRFSEVGGAGGDFPFAKTHLYGRTAHTKCGTHLLASSLAAALLNSLFEHPEATGVSTQFSEILTIFLRNPSFSAACLAGKKSVSFSQTSILHYSGLSITYDKAPVSPS